MPTRFLTGGNGSNAPSAGPAGWGRPPSGHVLGDLGGQRKSELRAALRAASDGDPTAVGLHEPPHQVQPEAGAAAAATLPEPGEHPLHVLFGDALALVGHGDGHHPTARTTRPARLRAL